MYLLVVGVADFCEVFNESDQNQRRKTVPAPLQISAVLTGWQQ